MIYTSPWPDVALPECSVWDLVWSNPNKLPDSRVAIIDGPTGREYTRGQLRKECQQLAYGFANTLKLKPGSVVCIFSPNSFYYHLLVMACQCAGLVVSGANAAYTPSELEHQLTDSDTSLILCHPAVLEVALKATTSMKWSKKKQAESILLAVKSKEAGPAEDLFKTFDKIMSEKTMEGHPIKDVKSTIAYLGYSSGTSGKAKGVMTAHYQMTSVLSMLAPFPISEADTQLAVLPLNHIYGLTKVLHWPIMIGTKVVIVPKFELEPFCAIVQKYKATVCMLVPPIALLLAREPVVDKYDFSSMRLIISGAAPLGPELEKELSKRLKTNVAQAYGLTEASPTTHFCPLTNPKPGSIGPLLPMMRGRITDPETGKDVKPGEQGEIILQGPNVMRGYLNRPDANKETLLEDKDGVWLRTGDIAYVDEEGFYFVTDRLKELIKYSGFQVAPAELEATLLECPYVADAAVIGVWNEDRQTEFPRAYIVPSATGKKEKDVSAKIQEWMDGKVASHKKLRGGIRLTDVIPKSPSGKLLRRVLRDEAKKEEEERRAKTTKAKL